jgi:hypothetical protein
MFSQTQNILVGNNPSTGPAGPLVGSVAYITMNQIVMNSEQIAEQYASLTTIMAGRGITLP